MTKELDLIDRKILHELDKDARISTTKLGKKIRINRETINYRINKLQSKGIIRKFVTMTNPSEFGYYIYKLYFKFKKLEENNEKEMLNWIVNNDYIYWVASAKGKWDLNITIYAKSIFHFEKIMEEFFEKYGENITEQEFNITTEVKIMTKDWLLENKKVSESATVGGEAKETKLDKLDIELLKILANNGRMNASKIAEKLNISSRAVIYRIKELKRKNAITGFSTSLNYELLEKQFFKSILYFTTIDNKLKNRIIEYCKLDNNIGFLVFCIGSWFVELEILVDNNKQFYEVMDKFEKEFTELKSYEFMIFPKEHKFDWVPGCYKANN